MRFYGGSEPPYVLLRQFDKKKSACFIWRGDQESGPDLIGSWNVTGVISDERQGDYDTRVTICADSSVQ